jgi:hypothetical protein
MLYYNFVNDQRRQLESVGFTAHATVFDLKGQPVTSDTQDDSLTWIVRKS